MNRYWTHWHNVRYEFGKRVEHLQIKIVHHLPRWVKMWAFVEVTNRHFVDSGKVLGEITCVDAMKGVFYPND